MKNFKIYLLASSFVFGAASTSFAVTSASSLFITMYGVAVSTSTDCSSPVVLFDSSTGTKTDVMNNPVLGGGDIADGTYPCVMINMSDQITAVPAADDGTSCTAGVVTSSQDVCRSDNSCTFNLRSGTSFGATTSAHGTSTSPVEDIVTLYLTTNAPVDGGYAFVKPTSTSDTTHGMRLSSAFVVSGASAGKFVVDATGKIDGSGSSCNMNAPEFSFK